MARATDHVVCLVGGLLDFTQVVSAAESVSPRPADLQDVLHGVIDELQGAHPERDVTVDLSVTGRANGIPTVSPGGAEPRDERAPIQSGGSPVRLTAARTEEAVDIAVHTVGAPIPPAQIARLSRPMQCGAA